VAQLLLLLKTAMPNHDEEDDIYLTIEFHQSDIAQLAESVEFHWKNWPGSPQRPAEEQERLYRLKAILRVAMLEIMYHKKE